MGTYINNEPTPYSGRFSKISSECPCCGEYGSCDEIYDNKTKKYISKNQFHKIVEDEGL